MNLGVWELLLIFGIVILLFGTSKMRSLGSDLGNAIKGFRSSIRDGDATLSPPAGVMQEDARSRDERPI